MTHLAWIVLTAILVVALVAGLVLGSAAMDYSLPLEARLSISQQRLLCHTSDPTLILGSYLLIGTHGSAAYRLDTSICVDDRGEYIKHIAGHITSGAVKQWGLNQHYDLYSQLILGARYLHLEVAVYKGEWVTIHSYLAGTLMNDLNEIKSFLDDTTDGFALIHLQRFGTLAVDDDKRTATDFAKEYFRTYLEPNVTRKTLLTSLKKKMVLLNDETTANVELYPRDYTTDISIFDVNRSTVHFEETPPQYVDTNSYLLGFQWVMTPGAESITNDILNPFNQSGLFDLESVHNRSKLSTYLQTESELQQNFQIFIVDHLDHDMYDRIDAYNRQSLFCV